MERKSNKSIKIILTVFFLLSFASFSMEKLTTKTIRENAIRINALELESIDKIEEKEIIVSLDSEILNFDFDKWNIKEEAQEILENLAKVIIENNCEVKIVGHTDSKGSEKYNLALSEKRANSVKEKLIELGVNEEKIISVEGRGKLEPIYSNETEEGRYRNRRVEIYLKK